MTEIEIYESKDMINRVKMNPDKLSVDSLMRAFFIEAFNLGWTFGERSKVYNLCKNNSYDFEELLSILSPYIEFSNDEYSEPEPLKTEVWETELDFMSTDAGFFLYQFSLTEGFSKNSMREANTLE